MNDRYSSLHMETQGAKQRLTQVFQDRDAENLLPPQIEDALTAHEQKEAANRPWMPPENIHHRKVLRDSWKNEESAKGTDWTRRDMSAFSFTLTLLLLGTIAAANTDRPPFWLLIGPAPIAVGFVAIAFLRERFDLNACLFGLRRRKPQTDGRGQRRTIEESPAQAVVLSATSF